MKVDKNPTNRIRHLPTHHYCIARCVLFFFVVILPASSVYARPEVS